MKPEDDDTALSGLGRIADRLDEITIALEKAVAIGDLGAIANGITELGLVRLALGEASPENVDDYTKMNSDTLIALARQALEDVHEYECLALHGCSRSERASGRAGKDRLVDVCWEIGVRHLAERFKDIIEQHKTVYRANLKDLGVEDTQIEKDHSGKLSWWNV